MKIQEIRENIREKIEAMKSLNELAEKEGRDFTEDEQKRWNELEAEVQKLEAKLKREEELAKRAATLANVVGVSAGDAKEAAKVAKRFHLAEAVRSMAMGTGFQGAAAELHAEGLRAAAESGVSVQGFALPVHLLQRAMVVGTDSQGGYTVPDDMGGLIGPLTPNPVVTRLGATVLSGLRGNVPIPRVAGVAEPGFKTETGQADETSPTFDQIVLSPKALPARIEVSKQLLYQSNISNVEQFLRNELTRQIQARVDKAALVGAGGNEPTGILSQPGVNTIAIGTNGGPVTYAKLIEMKTAVAAANAEVEDMAYLLTPEVRGQLEVTPIDAGSGRFIYQDGRIAGYTAEVSNHLPKNLTKGSGTGLHALIFANWRDLIIGQWGVADIIVDPYTLSDTQQLRIVVHSFWDVALRHPESFSVIVDANPNA